MMVVKVYMWPNGDAKGEHLLCQASFTCTAQAKRDAPEHAVKEGERVYSARLYKGRRFGGPADGDPLGAQVPKRKVWREATIMGHRPYRGGRAVRGEWDLIGGALGAMLGSRLAPYWINPDG